MRTASAVADAPSYMLAFATSRPRSIATRVWNSNVACNVPWLTSGWYGVYAVANSERRRIWSTTAGGAGGEAPAAREDGPGAGGILAGDGAGLPRGGGAGRPAGRREAAPRPGGARGLPRTA